MLYDQKKRKVYLIIQNKNKTFPILVVKKTQKNLLARNSQLAKTLTIIITLRCEGMLIFYFLYPLYSAWKLPVNTTCRIRIATTTPPVTTTFAMWCYDVVHWLLFSHHPRIIIHQIRSITLFTLTIQALLVISIPIKISNGIP